MVCEAVNDATGCGNTVSVCVVAFVPLAFVTVKEIVYEPAVLKQILVGLFVELVFGVVPPPKSQSTLVNGAPVLVLVKLIQVPAQILF